MVSKDAGDDFAFFRQVYQRAVSGVVNYRGVIQAVSKKGIRHKLLGNGMGIVGATASLGFSCALDDHTYELLAYRKPESCGTPRAVGAESVKEMEVETFPHTFNSYDHESGRVLVAPTGPDPVLAGVRGDSPRAVLEAFRKSPDRRGGARSYHLRDQPVHRRPSDEPAVDTPQGVLGRLARRLDPLHTTHPGGPSDAPAPHRRRHRRELAWSTSPLETSGASPVS